VNDNHSWRQTANHDSWIEFTVQWIERLSIGECMNGAGIGQTARICISSYTSIRLHTVRVLLGLKLESWQSLESQNTAGTGGPHTAKAFGPA
jgi:hypothetical protein